MIEKIGRFDILAEIGQGAMGTVYKAHDTVLDRLVALKTVTPSLLGSVDTVARFQREARAAARLQHPNIVTIYDLGQADGVLYIAMELLEGMDLSKAMAEPGRLAREQQLRIVVEICRGLDYAHKQGVFHRDVKPANIHLRTGGGVKLVDFGIARLADSTMTQSGLVLGTPSYIAPEVLTGARVDHRADMWAVGVILFELARGAASLRGSHHRGPRPQDRQRSAPSHREPRPGPSSRHRPDRESHPRQGPRRTLPRRSPTWPKPSRPRWVSPTVHPTCPPLRGSGPTSSTTPRLGGSSPTTTSRALSPRHAGRSRSILRGPGSRPSWPTSMRS